MLIGGYRLSLLTFRTISSDAEEEEKKKYSSEAADVVHRLDRESFASLFYSKFHLRILGTMGKRVTFLAPRFFFYFFSFEFFLTPFFESSYIVYMANSQFETW